MARRLHGHPDRRYVALAFSLLALTILPVHSPAAPVDERVDIELYLSTYTIEMPASTMEATQATVEGWVVMIKKPPGESVPVDFIVTSQDQYVIGAVNPSILAFHREGTKYFNLTVVLQEDTPPGIGHRIDVYARADSLVGTDGDAAVVNVIGITEFDGEAEMLEQPKRVRPGGTASGVVQVTNTGTQYCEYYLELMTDQGGVAESVEFDIEVELTPNWVEKAPFSIEVVEPHQPGQYTITLGLMARLQDGTTFNVDNFDVFLKVEEAEDGSGSSFSTLVVVLAFIVVIGSIGVYLYQRRNRPSSR